LPYPVVLHLQDVLLVALTVMSLGSLAAWWATRGIAKTAGGR
jgi:ABC-type lipoprotein release transport system permease subunit